MLVRAPQRQGVLGQDHLESELGIHGWEHDHVRLARLLSVAAHIEFETARFESASSYCSLQALTDFDLTPYPYKCDPSSARI